MIIAPVNISSTQPLLYQSISDISPKKIIGNNLGTINPLTIDNDTDNQWGNNLVINLDKMINKLMW